MDTKMKLPPMVVIFADEDSDERCICAGGGDSLTRAQALEVISRCNAAPKLVEALRNIALLSNCEASRIEARAILKETGAEK